jgi:NADH dehydrogenase [ubiquinone] 1 alpha subcomplex assembly factor 1
MLSPMRWLPAQCVKGLHALWGVLLMVPTGSYAEGLLVTDFSEATSDLGWYVVNDNVMGGRSDGGFEIADGELRFTGSTITRGGGFSSIRSAPLELDLSSYAGIRVRVRADGRRYTWRLTTDARLYGREVAYWADFETVAGEWQDVDIPFADFIPQFRGAVLDGPPLDTSRVSGMGLMIYDKLDGVFELQLADVRAYAASSSLDDLRWDRRVLALSARSADDPALKQQLAAIEEAGAGFGERDLLLVTLTDDGSARAGDEPLASETVHALRERLGIGTDSFELRLVGKDGEVKLGDSEVVSMSELFGLIDGMPMRQREMQDR